MALALDDPLSTKLYGLGVDQLSAYDPTAEAARKDKAWGQTEQALGERYARAGLTGSSQELGDFANTAKNFNLDWAERQPKQEQAAIASVLPIQNFRRSVANDFTSEANANRLFALQGETADQALYGNLLASSGLPSWLFKQLFGTTTPAAQPGTGTTGLVPQGLSALWKLLGGDSAIAGEGFTPEQLNALDSAINWEDVDWWNYWNVPGDVGGVTDYSNVLGNLSLDDLTGYF